MSTDNVSRQLPDNIKIADLSITDDIISNSTGNVTIDTTGNVVINATSNLVVKSNSSNELHFGYEDLRNDGVSGGEWKIVNTDTNSNIHLVTTDSNGAQNNVMVADSYGRVGIGTTPNSSSYALDVYGGFKGTSSSGDNEFRVIDDHIKMEFIGSNCVFQKEGTNDTKIYNNGGGYLSLGASSSTDHMVIKNNGHVGIGTTNPDTNLHFHKQFDDSASLDEVASIKFSTTNGTTQWDVGEITSYIKANNGSNGDYPGGIAIKTKSPSDPPTGADLTTKMVIDANGKVGIGTTSPDTNLHVRGNLILQNTNQSDDKKHYWSIQPGGTSNVVDNLFFYSHASGIGYHVGYIEDHHNSGGTHRMNDFTGQHKNFMNQNIDINKVGLIVSTTDNYINLDNSIVPKINESLPYCVLANTDNDKKVFGVISDKEDTETSREYSSGNFISVFKKSNTNEQRFHINSVGEGAIWVSNKNGTLESGDYITSTTVTGYGGKQITNADFLMNYTVAKITCNCTFDLIKIVKQKLKVNTSTDSDGITTTSIDYDANGDPQYEDDLDENGNQQMVYPLETRFLQADGTLLIDEADYQTRLGNGEEVYIACFVGCTYHCG